MQGTKLSTLFWLFFLDESWEFYLETWEFIEIYSKNESGCLISLHIDSHFWPLGGLANYALNECNLTFHILESNLDLKFNIGLKLFGFCKFYFMITKLD